MPALKRPVVTVDDDGRRHVPVPVRDQEFRFLCDIPTMARVDLAKAMMAGSTDDDVVIALSSLEDYWVHPADRKHLKHYLRTAVPTIDFDEIVELVGKILQTTGEADGADFPTQPASTSELPPAGSGTPSRRGSSRTPAAT